VQIALEAPPRGVAGLREARSVAAHALVADAQSGPHQLVLARQYPAAHEAAPRALDDIPP
jgi:hypothetical protein